MARAARALAGRYTCSVPPGRAQREPQGYAGLTRVRVLGYGSNSGVRGKKVKSRDCALASDLVRANQSPLRTPRAATRSALKPRAQRE